MNRKDRQEYKRILDQVERRIMAGKARFGDRGLRKYYIEKLREGEDR